MKTKNIFLGNNVLLVILFLIMSMPAVFAANELCLSGEECLTEAQAKEKFTGEYYCKLGAVCDYEYTRTAKTPKYCCKQETPTLTAAKLGASRITTVTAAYQCPTGCECLIEADANTKFNGNYEKCADTACGTSTITKPDGSQVQVQKYCYKSGPVGASVGAKVGDKVCPTGCECLTEDNANTKFNGNYEKCAADYLTDSICGQETITKPDGSQVLSYKYCFKEKSQPAQCPTGCECLDDAVAKEKGLKLCNNQQIRCALSTTATAAPQYGHCYEKPTAAECPTGCDCLTEEEGKKLNYNLCDNKKTECTLATGAMGACFEKPAARECPQGCNCLTKYDAEETTHGQVDLCNNQEQRCETTTGFNGLCYENCPSGCICLHDDEAEEKGLNLCNNIRWIKCKTDPTRLFDGHCYEKEVTTECPTGCVCKPEEYKLNYDLCNNQEIKCTMPTGEKGLCIEVPTTKECPTGCDCLVEEKAKSKFNGNYELCADIKCGTETVIKPDGTAVQVAKQCFRGKPLEYICPQGCICLKREDGEKKGLSICPPSATECKITGTNEWGICFKLGEKDCRYDYDNNACVGMCPLGQKCQLNTIYRDSTTGKVTYAECHCKEPPMQKCPDNCRCLTKKEGYENGLGFCNNEVTICDYLTSDALTTAAPNALGVPKYCFSEKVYAKCPDNCECIKRDEASEKGYELCNGVVRECGAGLYCFQKPVVEICGKDTLVVTRRINPKSVSSPAYVTIYLSVKPVKMDIKGIIITETIPEGMEPAWDYAVVTFDPDVEKKIEDSPFASEVVKTIGAKWTSRKPDSWDPDTREAKWVIKDDDGIKPQTFMYKLKVVGLPTAPEPYNPATYTFNGNWLISSGETCPIIGEDTVEVKPPSGWPPCPISDLELLKYIDMWAAGELTDMQILQAVKIWANAPPCPFAITNAGVNDIQISEKSYKYENLVSGFRNCLRSVMKDIGEIRDDDTWEIKIDDDPTWTKCRNSYAAILGNDFISKLGDCLKENGEEGKVAIDDDPTWSKCKSEYAGTTFTQLSPQPDPPGMGLSDPDPPP